MVYDIITYGLAGLQLFGVFKRVFFFVISVASTRIMFWIDSDRLINRAELRYSFYSSSSN